jgi:hypothetical protein
MNNNYKIGLSSRTYMQDGAVLLAPLSGTNLRGLERRVSRTKTLDGGCVITDGGISAGDKKFNISLASTKALWDLIRGIFSGALWVTVSTDESCYLAKIENISEAEGKITISVLIKEDLVTLAENE